MAGGPRPAACRGLRLGVGERGYRYRAGSARHRMPERLADPRTAHPRRRTRPGPTTGARDPRRLAEAWREHTLVIAPPRHHSCRRVAMPDSPSGRHGECSRVWHGHPTSWATSGATARCWLANWPTTRGATRPEGAGLVRAGAASAAAPLRRRTVDVGRKKLSRTGGCGKREQYAVLDRPWSHGRPPGGGPPRRYGMTRGSVRRRGLPILNLASRVMGWRAPAYVPTGADRRPQLVGERF